MSTITLEELRKFAPKGNVNTLNAVVSVINERGDDFHITTDDEITQFLGQCYVESTGFSKLVESLNYSAKRMTEVWPKRFPSIAAAAPYANNEKALGNYTYGGRMGNKPGSNDGYNFRGRGIKQLTGRENYTNFNKWLQANVVGAPDVVKNPEKVAELPWAVLSAVWFWSKSKVYEVAHDVTASTKRINGGTTGLTDRKTAVNRAKKILVPQPSAVKVAKKPKPNEADSVLKEYQEKLNRISDYKDIPEINVGKTDGWFGAKTEKAIKLFQRSANLKVDGILGDETKEAIDNVVAVIETGKESSIEEDLDPETNKEVVVSEVPVAIPTKLVETVDKPLVQNKTLWTYVTGAASALFAFYQKGVDGITNFFGSLSETTQIALIILLAIIIILGWLSIKDMLRSKKGITELKNRVDNIKSRITSEEAAEDGN